MHDTRLSFRPDPAQFDFAVRLDLDLHRYVDFCRGDREVLDRVREAERIYLPCYVPNMPRSQTAVVFNC